MRKWVLRVERSKKYSLLLIGSIIFVVNGSEWESSLGVIFKIYEFVSLFLFYYYLLKYVVIISVVVHSSSKDYMYTVYYLNMYRYFMVLVERCDTIMILYFESLPRSC